MHDPWHALVDRLFCPARPELGRCLRERESILATRSERQAVRARAIARCVEEIDEARLAVFAADDGVVGARMTELEREWRRLAREDPEAGLMDAWARLVAAPSLDRKRWRDSAPADYVEALVALAADDTNVRAAERAVQALRAALAPHGVCWGARVQWRFPAEAAGCLPVVPLSAALRFAGERCPARDLPAILERADRIAERVTGFVRARFPAREGLAAELGHAAELEFVWHTAGLEPEKNPARALRALWETGYAVQAFDAVSVTLEFPRLAGS